MRKETMNQPERDELRAKHHVGQNEAEDQCQACYSADGYPCDVIKVLDWADRVINAAEVYGVYAQMMADL